MKYEKTIYIPREKINFINKEIKKNKIDKKSYKDFEEYENMAYHVDFDNGYSAKISFCLDKIKSVFFIIAEWFKKEQLIYVNTCCSNILKGFKAATWDDDEFVINVKEEEEK